MNKFIHIILTAIIIAGTFEVTLAQNAAADPQTPWWMTNSLKYSEKHQGMRYHAEGEYSTYISTGQVSAYIHKSAPYIFIRNGRLQLSAFGNVTYQKLRVQSDPATRTKMFTANPKVFYDLTRKIQWEVGTLIERNDPQFIKLRSAVYTGVLFNNSEHSKLGKLLFIAFGQEYVNSTELPDDLGVEKSNNPIVYIQQRFMLKTIPKVSLTEAFTFVHGIENNGIYRLDLDLKAMYQLSSHLSGMIQYQLKFEEEPIIPELASYYEKTNTALTFGVRLNF